MKVFSKGRSLLGAVLFFCASIAGAELVSVSNDLNDNYSVEVLSDTGYQTELSFNLNGFQSNTLDIEGEEFQKVGVTNSGVHWVNGNPELPMIGKYLSIPSGAEVSVEIIDETTVEFDGYNVLPAQPDSNDSYEYDVPHAWAQNEDLYATDQFYPELPYRVEGPYTVRSDDMVLVRIYPIQINPVTGVLKVYSNLKLRVSYTHQSIDTVTRDNSEIFTSLVDRLSVNDAEVLAPASVATDDDQMLLIITADEFADAAYTLKTWKEQKGIETVVVTKTEAGSDENEIKAYIQNAYDNWDLKPTYVLLIGDAEHIPVHYVIDDWEDYIDEIGTDLYYGTVAGGDDDFMPDISVGRISADTLDQANIQVNKVINYEKNPPSQASYYQNIMLAGYFQDYDPQDGMADRRYAHTMEDLAIFFSDPNYLGEYSVDRIYYASSSVTPQYWNDASTRNHYVVGPAGNPGDPIPSYLTRASGFAWDGDTQDIHDALNAGRFLAFHRDHGSSSGWSQPSYYSSDLDGLSNGELLPVVFSVNCMTGFFNGSSESFTENLTRLENGGAVGVVGATSVTHSWHNNVATFGWVDAIWPSFVSDYNGENGGINGFEPPIYEMGQVLNYGKFFLMSKIDSGEDHPHHELYDEYHWFGDPTMEIWTAVPQDMNVTYSAQMTDLYTVSVEVDISDAVIAMSKNGELIAKDTSIAGVEVTYTLDEPVLEGEKIDVVITKHNYRPFIGEAKTGEQCDSFTSSLDEHVTENRAEKIQTSAGWWWMPASYEYRALGSGDVLGTSGTATATLIKIEEGYYEEGDACVSTSAPVLNTISTSVDATDVTVTGQASDADNNLALIQVKVDDGDWQDASGTSSWSITITGLSNGGHTVNARAIDSTGKVSNELSENINIIAEIAPEITSASYTVKQNRMTVTGTAYDQNGNLDGVYLLYGFAEDLCSGTDSFTCVFDELDPGYYTVAVKAKDTTGLESVPSEEYSFTIYAPTAPTVDSAVLAINGADVQINGTASDVNNDLESVSIELEGLTATCMGSSSYSCNLNLSSLSSGIYTANITATDELGQTSAAYEVEVNYVENLPVIDEITSTQVSQTTLTIGGTASDADGDLTAVYATNGVDAVLCEGTEYFSCAIEDLARGETHSYTVYAVDAAGNDSVQSDSVTVYVGYPPVVTGAITSINGQNVTITVSGTDSENDIVGAVIQGNGGRIPCAGTNNLECELANLDPGTYTYEVQLVDEQMNMSELHSVTFTIDPVVTCITAVNTEHAANGRAVIKYNILAYAVGSNQYLGLSSSTTSLEETSPGVWNTCN